MPVVHWTKTIPNRSDYIRNNGNWNSRNLYLFFLLQKIKLDSKVVMICLCLCVLTVVHLYLYLDYTCNKVYVNKELLVRRKLCTLIILLNQPSYLCFLRPRIF